MTRFVYTEAHLRFLTRGYAKYNIRKLTRVFNARFGLEKTEVAIKAALGNHDIRCHRDPSERLVENRKIKYTQKHLAWIRRNCAAMSRKELTDNFNEKFNMDITVSMMHALFGNHNINSGRTGYYEKGHKPWNTGTKGATGANSTSFKKGSVPPNTKDLWSERIDSKDGYILMKVPEKNPYTGHKTRYKAKHIWNWEQINGPMPKGHKIFFIDGDRMNCDVNNLMCVSNTLCLRLNQHGYSEAAAELKPSILALAKLECKAFERKKEM